LKRLLKNLTLRAKIVNFILCSEVKKRFGEIFVFTALFLNLFDRHYRVSKGWMTILSAFLAVGATAYALIIGASLRECAGVLTVFLLLNMEVRE
jgi:hypothetical protein